MKKYFTSGLFFLMLFLSSKIKAIPKLNSYPSAPAVIFLDFDGHTVASTAWNGGNPIECAAAGMTDAQIIETFNRVAEDFRVFNLNITTDSTKFIAAPLTQRMRIIITPTNGWYQGVGGVSYVGSFTWGDDTPGFVFCNGLPVGGPVSPKMVAECCSHESGHTLSLAHQSKYDGACDLVETYSTGTGNGEVAWSPIMGNSYYRNMTGWNLGPTQYGCTQTQDNLSIITALNGFTYRTDDFSETLNPNTYTLNSAGFNVNGIITTSTDKDAFKLSMVQNSMLHLSAIPFNVGVNDEGANLDIKISLYNAAGALIKEYNPASVLNVTFDTVLNSGTYYIKIDGTGNTNASEYGSIGSYTISGFATSTLPIHDIALKGNTQKNKHNLSWNIIADEPIKRATVELSVDGRNFAALTTLDPALLHFSYQPTGKGNLYYRVKATSAIGQSVYSNTIVLGNIAHGTKAFNVSTLVNTDIKVSAPGKFQYSLYDVNGKKIRSGNGAAGVNSIDVLDQPAGIYIIQISGNNEIQTERIIKQ